MYCRDLFLFVLKFWWVYLLWSFLGCAWQPDSDCYWRDGIWENNTDYPIPGWGRVYFKRKDWMYSASQSGCNVCCKEGVRGIWLLFGTRGEFPCGRTCQNKHEEKQEKSVLELVCLSVHVSVPLLAVKWACRIIKLGINGANNLIL